MSFYSEDCIRAAFASTSIDLRWTACAHVLTSSSVIHELRQIYPCCIYVICEQFTD